MPKLIASRLEAIWQCVGLGWWVLFLLLVVAPSALWAQDIAQVKKGVVKITAQADGKAKVWAGFIVRLEKDAVYVVTAAHVVQGDPKPQLTFYAQRDTQYTATVQNAEGNGKQDLALLLAKVPPDALSGVTSLEGRNLNIDTNIQEGNSGGPIIHGGKAVGLVMARGSSVGLGVTAASVQDYLEGFNVTPRATSSPEAVASSPTSLVRKSVEPRKEDFASQITGKDAVPMVLVPAGEFMMGARDDDKSAQGDERPAHSVYLDAFYLDQYEVTTLRYATFFQETNRAAPANWSEQVLKQHGNKPVVEVGWNDATAYCAWAGKRLPTEAEWEKAARGNDQRLYPWGNAAPNQQLANYDRGFYFKNYGVLTDVGSYERGKSPYAAYDMAGNVWEWTADWYDETYYKSSPERNPKGPSSGHYRVLRGGSWYTGPVSVRSAYRYRASPAKRLVHFGVRCAQDIPK